MKKNGRNKRTRDRLGRRIKDLRISVIDRCNYRCPYCMPESEFPGDYEFFRADERLTYGEIERVARVFARLGVEKIRITGGEPLLRKDLHTLLAQLRRIPGIRDLAMTTNGVLLRRQAWALKSAGLDRVSVSLDSLDDQVYARMSGGRGNKAPVLEGIGIAMQAGLGPVKINVVVQRGVNDHTILDLIEFFRGRGPIVRLIEYMDVGNRNQWRLEQVVPSAELRERIHARWPLILARPNYGGEVARRYVFEDGGGEIGFISSVTEPFCGGCTRARISTSGVLYTCLFATRGTDLRGPLRAGIEDEELLEIIRGAWTRRSDRYSEERNPERSGRVAEAKVEMYQVGG